MGGTYAIRAVHLTQISKYYDMDYVLQKYHYPLHPTTVETTILNQRVRPACVDYAEVQPL